VARRSGEAHVLPQQVRAVFWCILGINDDPPRADKLRKGWSFRVATWNVHSLTGRSGELVEALAERRMDVACGQETRWRGSGCRFFGAIGKRYKLFWMGSKANTDGVGTFVADNWVVMTVLLV